MNYRFTVLLGALGVAASSFGGVLTNAIDKVGNQPWTGTLGLDFNVGEQALTVTDLGAFDSAQNGCALGTTITVGIYDRTTMALVGSTRPSTRWLRAH